MCHVLWSVVGIHWFVPFHHFKRDQRIEREHVSRNWLGFRDFSSTKFWEFVTYLSRKMGIRDFHVTKHMDSWLFCNEKWGFRDFSITKNWDFVTFLSWNIEISWLICHETKLFNSRNSTFSWHISHEMGYFDGI